jgi:hypothetical protein
MRWLLPLLLFFVGSALAAEPSREIDPNTKIQGGADTEERTEAEKRPLSEPRTTRIPEKRDNSDAEKDKAISERKPQEREREDASRGETRNAPQQ